MVPSPLAKAASECLSLTAMPLTFCPQSFLLNKSLKSLSQIPMLPSPAAVKSR
jgi:hypothetical protein